jgi:hypothetical protein
LLVLFIPFLVFTELRQYPIDGTKGYIRTP